MDGDNDLDILSASRSDDKIAWKENLDGLGNFGNQQVISNQADQAQFVRAGDLDGDGDMDVLVGFSNEVVWYRNLLNDPAISGFCFFDENKRC